MIEVNVRLDGISVLGHAGYAPQGQYIVCAAVTALTQTLIKSFESLTTDKITYEISLGRVDIHYGCLTEAGKLLVDAFLLTDRVKTVYCSTQRKGGKQMGNKKNNPKRWTEWILQISAGVISGVISGLIVWFITK